MKHKIAHAKPSYLASVPPVESESLNSSEVVMAKSGLSLIESMNCLARKCLVALAVTNLIFASAPSLAQTQKSQNTLSTEAIASSLTEHARQNRFPNKMQFPLGPSGDDQNKDSVEGYVRYTFDENMHDDMAEVYLRYQPDYACFVAMDAETGAILNLTSFIKADEEWDNLVMRSDYPAASVFKMVTAAAGLDMGKLSPSTVIPFNGKSTTLYKNQVLKHKNNKWTRKPTLKESFAKSINSVFARIGIFDLGAGNLTAYANRFGFDREMNTDFNLPQSKIALDFDDKWEIAEAASGYTRDITLSPIHAAQMAAIVANDGKMVTPYMVESVLSPKGEYLYKAQHNNTGERVISENTAEQMRSLMQETTANHLQT